MSKSFKIFAVLLVANVFVKNLEASPVTVREIVNGFDEESTRYERLCQIAEALTVKIYQICRAAVMANSFYSERGLQDGFVRFADDDLEDFTFEPSEKPKATSTSNIESRRASDEESFDSEKKNESSTTTTTTTTTILAPAPKQEEAAVEKSNEEDTTVPAIEE
jgi:hypothetical protein